jgi:hypothetical protein
VNDLWLILFIPLLALIGLLDLISLRFLLFWLGGIRVCFNGLL